jgi:FkbM family methyltransferase
MYSEIEKKYTNNKELQFDLYNYPDYRLIKSSSHEPTEQKLICYFVNENDRVLELGAHIGASSIVFSKILKNPKLQQVSVEPNSNIVKVLKKNREHHNSHFNIIEGIISPMGDYFLSGDGLDGHIVKRKTGHKVKTYDVHSLDEKYNFNVLFADCEGSLLKFIKDYPDIHKKLRLIIYEKDGPIDYSKVDNYFYENKFKKTFNSKHHLVFSREGV